MGIICTLQVTERQGAGVSGAEIGQDSRRSTAHSGAGRKALLRYSTRVTGASYRKLSPNWLQHTLVCLQEEKAGLPQPWVEAFPFFLGYLRSDSSCDK